MSRIETYFHIRKVMSFYRWKRYYHVFLCRWHNIAFRMNREQAIDNLIKRLKTIFEFREISEIKHFLRMRVIIQNNNKNSSKSINRIIYLIQNAYVDKLVKNYEIKMKKRITQTLLSSLFILIKYENDLNQKRLHEFRQKIESICYSVTMIRFDITKTISKLIKF
jgi:hypothetical protein